MKEILGGNLKRFFDIVDSKYKDAEITYANDEYEVWSISDELFKKICDMPEEEFLELAGEDAWLRQSEGSVLNYLPIDVFNVNGKEMKGFKRDNDEFYGITSKYKSLTSYLCDYIGVSLPKNVCACAMDLAKYNNMTMSELFREYEG